MTMIQIVRMTPTVTNDCGIAGIFETCQACENPRVVLTTSNYNIRKVGKTNTQCIHRILFRSIKPQYEVADLLVIHSINFIPDPITIHCSEPTLFYSCDIQFLPSNIRPPVSQSYQRPFVSRIPRPLTPTPRGFSSPHFIPSSTPAPSLHGFQTSTLIHSQPPSSVISPSQDL